jgi:hypothetical protein
VVQSPPPPTSTMPAAIASTFFSAPDISTPTTSVDVLTRRQLDANRRCTLHVAVQIAFAHLKANCETGCSLCRLKG